MPFVEPSDPLVRAFSVLATRETIMLAAYKMSQAMATECVHAEEDRIQDEHDCPDADAETQRAICVVMGEADEAVPSQQADEHDRRIEKVTVDVLKDQRKLLLASVVLTAEGRLADRAACWVAPECLVVRASVVVAGESKAGREGEDEERWRKEHPCWPPRGERAKPSVSRVNAVWIPQDRRVKRREQLLDAGLLNTANKKVAALEGGPSRIDQERAETSQHKERNDPPIVFSLGLEKPTDLWKGEWIATHDLFFSGRRLECGQLSA